MELRGRRKRGVCGNKDNGPLEYWLATDRFPIVIAFVAVSHMVEESTAQSGSQEASEGHSRGRGPHSLG